MASAEELAEMERLSTSFVPEQTGDLVAAKSSTKHLIEEYARADPIFANKTKGAEPSINISILQNNQRRRQLWVSRKLTLATSLFWYTALAFGFLERLILSPGSSKLQAEAGRLKSLNHMLDATGQESYMYEDFVDVTIELIDQLAAMTLLKEREALLLSHFNAQDTSDAMTQHLRMLTSAQLKLNVDEYQPFIADDDVLTYCQKYVDPFAQEIEHIGLKALIDCVVNPAGVAVECLYLDRSPGDKATLYSFTVPESHATQGPASEGSETPIRLLYRPGHYDLLYKADSGSI